MNKQQQIIHSITTAGLLPLYFHSSQSISAGVLKALYDAGIRAVEYTNRGAEALANFIALKTVLRSNIKRPALRHRHHKKCCSSQGFYGGRRRFYY